MITDEEIESRIREAVAYAKQHGATVNVEALIKHRASGERGVFIWDPQTHEVHWAWLS